MSSLRVFLSYAQSGDEPGAEMARQLFYDLQTIGAEVILARPFLPKEKLISYLRQELSHCHSLLVVQTPRALETMQVQVAVDVALHLLAQQQLQGIWRLIAEPSYEMQEPSSWLHIRTIDASRNYSLARNQLLWELGLVGQTSRGKRRFGKTTRQEKSTFEISSGWKASF